MELYQRIWPSVSNIPQLSKNDVHVWRIYNNCIIHNAEMISFLSPSEIEKAKRFRVEGSKDKYVAARSSLRIILGAYLNVSPSDIQFSHTPQGKPYVNVDSESTGIQFNLSHSKDLTLIAVTNTRHVGIDVEYIRPISEMGQLVERFFSFDEKQIYTSNILEDNIKVFYKLWTRKEALSKALGYGLTIPLDKLDVSNSFDEDDGELLFAYGFGNVSKWSFYDINLVADYSSSLIVEGSGVQISFLNWC